MTEEKQEKLLERKAAKVVAKANEVQFREEAISLIYYALVPEFEKVQLLKDGLLTFVQMATNVKFACSFLKGGLRRGVMASETHFPKVNGECHYELLVDIGIDDHLQVALNVAHQMFHIASGDEGHGARFKEIIQRMNANTDGHGLRGAIPIRTKGTTAVRSGSTRRTT